MDKEYEITFFTLTVQDDYSLVVDEVNRNNAVPNADVGDGWIHGYIEGFSEGYEHFFEEVEIDEEIINVLEGSSVIVFYLHQGRIDPKKPNAIFLDNVVWGPDLPRRKSSRNGITMGELSDRIEEYLVNEVARRSIDDQERRICPRD